MKNKKKILTVFFTLMSIFLLCYSIEVKATETEASDYPPGGIVTTCTYDDGSVYTFSVSSPEYKTNYQFDELVIKRSTTPLSVADETANFVAEISYLSQITSYKYPLRCPKFNRKALVESTRDGQNHQELYVRFSSDQGVLITEHLDSSLCVWCVNKKNRDYKASVTAAIQEANNNIVQLLAENFLLHDYSGASQSIMYEKQNENCNPPEDEFCIPEQASTQKEYIEIFVYKKIILLKKQNRTTVLDMASDLETKFTNNEKVKEIYINDPMPKTIVSPAGQAIVSYEPDQVRFSASLTGEGLHTERYVISDPLTGEGSEYSDDLCSAIPDTSKVLSQVIRWIQIIVPVLLILFVSIDITRIVLSGNPEEELPKRKKSIIARLIVAASIFFLPSIITLLIDLYASTGAANVDKIESIRCLFDYESVVDAPSVPQPSNENQMREEVE